MAHAKDEIEIKFSKKDTIYLSIIMVLVCVVALVAILVPRYYKVNPPTTPPLNNESTSQSPSGDNKNNNTGKNNSGSSDSSADASNNNSQDTANSADNEDANSKGNLDENAQQSSSADNTSADDSSKNDEAENIIADPAYYTIKVMQILKNVGKPYSSSSKYLDSDGKLNYSKLNPSDAELKEIETSAKSLYELLDNYLKQDISITKDLINNNDKLTSEIGSFTDIVNTIAEN